MNMRRNNKYSAKEYENEERQAQTKSIPQAMVIKINVIMFYLKS